MLRSNSTLSVEEDVLFSMGADEFTAELADEYTLTLSFGTNVELANTKLAFADIKFGLVPKGLSRKAFEEIAKLQNSWLYPTLFYPLCPVETVDGMTEDALDDLNASLIGKAINITQHIFGLVRRNPKLKPVFCRYFNINEPNGTMRTLCDVIEKRVLIPLEPQHEVSESCTLEKVVFNIHASHHDTYVGKPQVANSFMAHIQRLITSNPNDYYASYFVMRQSSGMGKTRIFHENWEDENHRLVIFRINCADCGDMEGYYNYEQDTRRLAYFFQQTWSIVHTSYLIVSMLTLFLNMCSGREGILASFLNLAFRLEALVFYFADILSLYESINVSNFDEKINALKNQIENLRGELPDSTLNRKAIPIVVFDEADVLVNQKLEFGDGTSISAFEIIRQALNRQKNELWACPFIFVGNSPELLNPASIIGYDDVKTNGSLKLFDSYLLKDTLHAFMPERNECYREYNDLGSYVVSSGYTHNLRNCGRPLWGATQRVEKGRPCKKCDFPTEEIMTYAMSKIDYHPNLKYCERVLSAMAIAGISIAANWSGTKYAAKLFENKMAILLNSDGDQSKPAIVYPPEPVLAIAALTLLKKYPSQIICDLMEVIQNEQYEFTRIFGSPEELISKLWLLLSIPLPSLEKPYFSVRAILLPFIGREGVKTVAEYGKVCDNLKGYACFSCLTSLGNLVGPSHREFDEQDLIHFNAALSITKSGNLPASLFIPVVCKNGKMDGINIVMTASSHLSEEEIITHSKDASLHIIMDISHSASEILIIKELSRGALIKLQGWKTCSKIFLQHPNLEKQLLQLIQPVQNDIAQALIKATNPSDATSESNSDNNFVSKENSSKKIRTE